MIEESNELVGIVSSDVAEYWKIKEQKGKPIIKGNDWLRKHGEKHKKEFKCLYNYHQAIKNIPLILKYPDYVFYNKDEKGLEYFKTLEEDVSLIVRVTGKKKLYLATIYPSSIIKRENRKNKEVEILEPELYKKYVCNFEEE